MRRAEWACARAREACPSDTRLCSVLCPTLAVLCGHVSYMKDAFDYLYEEGGRMMNVGLHMRLIGHPSRVAGLRRFLEYVRSFGSTVCPSLSLFRSLLVSIPEPLCVSGALGASCSLSVFTFVRFVRGQQRQRFNDEGRTQSVCRGSPSKGARLTTPCAARCGSRAASTSPSTGYAPTRRPWPRLRRPPPPSRRRRRRRWHRQPGPLHGFRRAPRCALVL